MNQTGRNLRVVAQEAKEHPYRITAIFIQYGACGMPRSIIKSGQKWPFLSAGSLKFSEPHH
jgi:hypothetical protein